MLKGIQEKADLFLEKHKWILWVKWSTIFIVLIPHITFWLKIYFLKSENKKWYPPIMTDFIESIFFSVLLGAAPLLLALLITKRPILSISIFFLGTIYLCIFLLFLFALLWFNSEAEHSRTEKDGEIYTVISYLDDFGHSNFCLDKYHNEYSYERIECFYVTFNSEVPEMTLVNDTILVFIEGNLRYMYGDNPFSEKWLDSIIFENYLFNLECIENDEEIIYQLFKCNKNNTQCSQEPFHFTISPLEYEYGTLHILAWGEQDHFTISFDDKLGYDHVYYSCNLDGCVLK
mgnify:CR=1 FL=1